MSLSSDAIHKAAQTYLDQASEICSVNHRLLDVLQTASSAEKPLKWLEDAKDTHADVKARLAGCRAGIEAHAEEIAAMPREEAVRNIKFRSLPSAQESTFGHYEKLTYGMSHTLRFLQGAADALPPDSPIKAEMEAAIDRQYVRQRLLGEGFVALKKTVFDHHDIDPMDKNGANWLYSR
jgi:hypothetical protein